MKVGKLAVGMLAVMLVCCCAPAEPVRAQSSGSERILEFHSDIEVHDDASMTVTETITAFCAGKEIKRGIYRDFPTKYKDQWGITRRVGLSVIDVVRDGRREPYHFGHIKNGRRIYIGKEDVFLKQGEHTFKLRYKTDRQLGFFADHDELFWNVTGNGWAFPIEKASATIKLPAGVQAADIRVEGYTGPQAAGGRT